MMIRHILPFFAVLMGFFAYIQPICSQTRADSVAGTWLRNVETTNEASGTKEIQYVQRAFAADGVLTETVIYEENVTSPEGEAVTLFLRCHIKGSWALINNERDILINYKPATLHVVLNDIRFPLRADDLQNDLRASFLKKNHHIMKNYTRTMQNVLKTFYKNNDNSIFKDISLTNTQMTATLGNETVYFLRK